MVEPISTTEQGIQTAEVTDKIQAVQDNAQEKQPDLVSRVSRVKPPEQTPDPTTTTGDETFNVNDIDKIQDPDARAYAQKAYKSLEKGYQLKFQELADQRKQFEAQNTYEWTPDKVRSLTKDPNFVSAAQQIMGAQNAGLTEDEYSALTDKEKTQLTTMQQQINNVTQQNQVLVKQQEDDGLRTKYSNYNVGMVDTAVQNLLAGKVTNTREWIHKALDYEDGIKRAYQLGLEDRKLETNEKASSASVQGGAPNIQPSGEVPIKEEKESPVEYFKRLAYKRLAQNKQQ